MRPTVEENVTSKGQEQLPPEGPGGQRGRNDSKDKAETSEEQRAKAELQGVPDSSTQKCLSVIKPVIPVANDDSAVNIGAQSTGTPYNAVIKDAAETPEEMYAEEEPQESPTSSHVIESVISVAYDNSVNFGVQSAGIFCDTAINGDLSSADSRGDYNLEQAETAATVTEFEQQAEAAAAAMELKQVEIAALPAAQAEGKVSLPKGGRGGQGRGGPPRRGRGGRGLELVMSDP